jgi:hypothetical protein
MFDGESDWLGGPASADGELEVVDEDENEFGAPLPVVAETFPVALVRVTTLCSRIWIFGLRTFAYMLIYLQEVQ